MSIKLKLRLTYIAMIVIPFILIVIISNIFMFFVGVEMDNYLGNKIQRNNYNLFYQIISSNNKLLRNINKQVLQDPDKFLEHEYLLELEKAAAVPYSGIVLKVNNKIEYSSDYLKNYLEEADLPSFNEDQQSQRNKNLYILGRNDFYFKDRREGSIFYVLYLEEFKGIFRENSIIIIISSFVILILTNIALSHWISKSLIKPLKELEKAADEIRQGNLDYAVHINSKDEVGQVSKSFEEMRLRLKKSLELQRQYEENRKELISNISHDLKTPITSIKGYVEGIKDGVADTPEKVDKYVSTIYTKAVYMDNLINDLFLFSKLDLNKVEFKFQSVDIINYLRDCVEEINFDLDLSAVNLTLEVPAKAIMVKLDVQQLKRTIMNIVGNSIKYKADRKLNINIGLKEEAEEVIVEIRDNGKGISKESLPYVFDRFYRADASRESRVGGSGLGLAIAKKIIEEHKGNTWIESELNKGTSIFFSLKKL
jgi:histidine kinase